jgi:hypothetical protein
LLIGFNWNIGSSWVLGIEAYSEIFEHEASIADRIPGLGGPVDPDSVFANNPNSFVVVQAESAAIEPRLRFGYLLSPELFLYVAAGQSELEIEVTSVCPGDLPVCNPLGETSLTTLKNLDATVGGVGIEYAFDSLLLRLDYLTADFGSFDFTALNDEPGVSVGADARLSVESYTLQLGATLGF